MHTSLIIIETRNTGVMVFTNKLNNEYNVCNKYSELSFNILVIYLIYIFVKLFDFSSDLCPLLNSFRQDSILDLFRFSIYNTYTDY